MMNVVSHDRNAFAEDEAICSTRPEDQDDYGHDSRKRNLFSREKSCGPPCMKFATASNV